MIGYSLGNFKLPDDTFIFNVPARATCPGRTTWCDKHCYALKAERFRPNVRPARKRNLAASLMRDFDLDVLATINRVRHKINRVRIHESGDFYGQDYLNAWYRIARARPDLIFYAYTKSFKLSFGRKPDNLKLIASFDGTTTPESWLDYKRRRKVFTNTFTVGGAGDRVTCPGDCRKCSRCWTRTGRREIVAAH